MLPGDGGGGKPTTGGGGGGGGGHMFYIGFIGKAIKIFLSVTTSIGT